MTELPRAVLDTNVFLSAFVLRKKAFRLAEAWFQSRFVWIMSPDIEEEYRDVIARPKFQQTKEEVEEIENMLEEAKAAKLMEYVVPEKSLSVIADDPKDNMFLECAVAGRAGYIVTGDRHLLDLKSYKNISVSSLNSFLKVLSCLS